MRQRILSVTAVLTCLLMPAVAFAVDDADIDPRTEGYTQSNVILKGGSTALTWMLLIFLTLICIAVLFKNARRTHLD